MSKIQSFENLYVWEEARILHKEIHGVSGKKELAREFSIVDQVRRSAVSVMANVAEGFGRHGLKDAKNFYIVARGSLNETQSHLYALKDRALLSDGEFERLYQQSAKVGKMLNALITSVVRRLGGNN